MGGDCVSCEGVRDEGVREKKPKRRHTLHDSQDPGHAPFPRVRSSQSDHFLSETTDNGQTQTTKLTFTFSHPTPPHTSHPHSSHYTAPTSQFCCHTPTSVTTATSDGHFTFSNPRHLNYKKQLSAIGGGGGGGGRGERSILSLADTSVPFSPSTLTPSPLTPSPLTPSPPSRTGQLDEAFLVTPFPTLSHAPSRDHTPCLSPDLLEKISSELVEKHHHTPITPHTLTTYTHTHTPTHTNTSTLTTAHLTAVASAMNDSYNLAVGRAGERVEGGRGGGGEGELLPFARPGPLEFGGCAKEEEGEEEEEEGGEEEKKQENRMEKEKEGEEEETEEEEERDGEQEEKKVQEDEKIEEGRDQLTIVTATSRSQFFQKYSVVCRHGNKPVCTSAGSWASPTWPQPPHITPSHVTPSHVTPSHTASHARVHTPFTGVHLKPLKTRGLLQRKFPLTPILPQRPKFTDITSPFPVAGKVWKTRKVNR